MPRSTSKLLFAWMVWATFACGTSGGHSAGTGGGVGTGGMDSGTGGASTKSGTGGNKGRGGNAGSGGTSASGGKSSTGGTVGAGGMAGAGGGQSLGGSSGNGGTVASDASSGPDSATLPFSKAKCPDTDWKLFWGDDFEGAAGSAADASKWAYDFGPNWYNGELQDYTEGKDNAKLDGSGNLVIEARQESREGRQYTSARLKTQGKKTFTYGRIESRMKLPAGQGMWPAFWLLGAQGGEWPACGEIDVMENLGREPSMSHGTMHGPGYSGADGPAGTYTLPDNAKFADDFHTFAIEWEADAIRWYVDGYLFSTKTKADTSGKPWVFDHPFYIILNLAVGGQWPGNPDATTVFPQKMIVDYVRVCQR